MFFFGWGKRSKERRVSDKKSVILVYSYFDVFFVFSLAFSYHYQVATLRKEGWHVKDIPKEEATKLLGGEEFIPHWWWRFGLLIFIACAFILAAILSSV